MGAVIGGPLFIVVVVLQELLREGFDPERHTLSQLSTGELGWLQVANFVGTGVLFVAGAVGMRRALRDERAGTWGPRLFGAFGAALVWGGVFVTDPVNAFPPGTPDGVPDEISWHGALHIVGPAVAGIALVAAGFVFARRFAALGQPGWRFVSIAVSTQYLVLGFAGFAVEDFRLVLVGGILIWGWASAVAFKLLRSGATHRLSTSAFQPS